MLVVHFLLLDWHLLLQVGHGCGQPIVAQGESPIVQSFHRRVELEARVEVHTFIFNGHFLLDLLVISFQLEHR